MSPIRVAGAAALLLAVAWSMPAMALVQVEVTDGDSVRVASPGTNTGYRVRVLGMDTPEINGRCPEERALAQEARDTLIRLVAPGVTFITEFRADRYGRLLARMILADGRDAAEAMIALRLARAYTGVGARQSWCPGVATRR